MTRFSHVVLNVSKLSKSLAFYTAVLEPLGISVADQEKEAFARLTNGEDLVIVLSQTSATYNEYSYHRKATGLNHIALSVGKMDDIDKMEYHLNQLGINLLGEGKCSMDYRKGYYSLFFEDPDRIMIEIVWHNEYYFSRDVCV